MEFQLTYFKSWKMMLWKCCTQYVSKFGKLSSGHRTGKGQFSFQSQRKATPKNAQTTAQLHSHASKYSKFSKPGFSNTWTVNFQMFKLVLEKAEEPEIQLPTSAGSLKKQESSRKTSISALLTMPKPLCESESRLVVPDSLRPHGLYSPWNSPGQNTGVASLSLLQGSSQPRDRTQVSCTAGRFFISWATREAQEYWSG